MAKPIPRPSDLALLRQRAEERLGKEDKPLPPALDEAESRRLVHELQVHQVELEMQNAELLQAREDMTALLDAYTDLYDFAPVGYLTVDRGGAVLKANLTAASLLGIERSRLVGAPFNQLLAADSQDAFRGWLREQFAGNGPSSCDLACLPTPGRAAWLRMETAGAAVTEECRFAFVDISERKRTEASLRKFEADLIHAEKLESLGSLAAGIAHDINNVLAAIYAVVETQKLKHEVDSELIDTLDIITRATNRGRNLVGGLTAFARKDLLESEPINLNALVTQEVALLQQSTLQRIEFELHLADPAPHILGERGRLAAALMNLCVNAIDAIPGRGRVSLRTARVPGTEVELTVLDTGPGMPQEVLARATDPFFTTKPFGKGTGLGLSTAYATVRAHGGSMRIESAPGEGTKVTLRFPELLAAEKPASTPRHSELSGPLNILLVDDDDLIRAAVPGLIKSLGHQVEAVSGGREALGRIEGSPKIDLVILDRNMPELDGLETLVLMRKTQPQLPILLATGNLAGIPESILKKDRYLRVIAKPYTLEEIEIALGGFRGQV